MLQADLPALGRSADEASGRAQRIYLILYKTALGLTLAGALASSIAVTFGRGVPYASIISALVIAGGMAFTLAIKILAPERTWFAGRAVAESIKTSAWRYAMCAEPFLRNLDEASVDARLMSEFREIVRQRKVLSWDIGLENSELAQITSRMREVRGFDLDSRRDIYRTSRIENQQIWYAKKAKSNQRIHELWMAGVIFAQLAALLWAILMIWHSELTLNLTPVFAALVAALMAWSQVKRYQEIGQSYALAAHELGMIAAFLPNIHSESQFAAFVADAESAISREHTMWLARRDLL